MATGTPTIATRPTWSPVRGPGSQFRAIVTAALGNYVTGGIPVTLPTDLATGGISLIAVKVLNPIPAAGADAIFAWDGSASSPKLVGTVISTGAEIGSGVTTYAASVVALELIYGDNG